MNDSIGPQEIKKIAENLSGMKTKGVVEKQKNEKVEFFKIKIDNGFLVCIREGIGWNISLFGQDNKLSAIWSNNPSEKIQVGIQIIDLFFEKNGKSVNPVFEKEFFDIEHDIERKTYRSNIGSITLHTRRHPMGTEGIVEVTEEKLILRYLWERTSGGIDLSKVQKLSDLPF